MVVQAVVKANSQSSENGHISTPRGSKTLEQILMKLGIYHNVAVGGLNTCFDTFEVSVAVLTHISFVCDTGVEVLNASL